MKKLILFCVLAIVASCKKEQSQKPTSGTSTGTTLTQGFIPHWGVYTLSNGLSDSIVTFKVGDTTKLTHRGFTHYVWWRRFDAIEPDLGHAFTDSVQYYDTHCWIGDHLFDTVGAVRCSVSSPIHWDSYLHRWDTTQFSININSYYFDGTGFGSSGYFDKNYVHP